MRVAWHIHAYTNVVATSGGDGDDDDGAGAWNISLVATTQ